MKVKELIELLSEYNHEAETLVFANGELWPTLAVQEFDGDIEIGCGWVTIEDIEEFK